MRTLPRYVIGQFLQVFCLAFAGITLFMLIVGVGREAVREGLGLGPLVRLVPFILPDSMRFSIPASALLSACTVFGRMAGENEVVAIKSLGISPTSVSTGSSVSTGVGVPHPASNRAMIRGRGCNPRIPRHS